MQLLFIQRVNNIRCKYNHLDKYVFETLSKIIDFILNNIEDECQKEFSKKYGLENSAADSQEKLEKLKYEEKYSNIDQIKMVGMIFILAQTYYIGEKPNKKYLQEEIKDKKFLEI